MYDKIKAEIERRICIAEKYKDTHESAAAARQELIWMKDFIESMEEEQESASELFADASKKVNLAKEIENYQKQILVGENESYTKSAVAALLDYLARHFYSLGKESSDKECLKIKGWVVRFADGSLGISKEKPFYYEEEGKTYISGYDTIYIDKSLFPDLHWLDEPIEVELLIEKI